MEIIVLDIETTGFNTKLDAIVEIGMVLVNTDTKEITQLFNEVVYDQLFKEKYHKDAWIFQNSSLRFEDVINAKTLSEYKPTLQKLFDKYPVTAFNMPFDLRFLRSRGFNIRETKCLMKSSYPYYKQLTGERHNPSVEKMYDLFFKEEKYVEEHRGYDDALHEAKILLKLTDLKKNPMLIEEYTIKLEPLYPILFYNTIYEKEDCDKTFVKHYTHRNNLNTEGGVSMNNGKWIYPNGLIDNF